MSFNNKEYLKWKKDKKRKRSLILTCLTAIGIGGGVGIGWAIWNNTNNGDQPTPPMIDVRKEDGTDWEHTGSIFSGIVTLNGWAEPESREEYGTCSIASNTDYTVEDLVIPEYVRRNQNGKIYRITTIGFRAFDGNLNLSGDLTIPDSVKTISDTAFGGCMNLDGNLKIGKNVESIGSYAFNNCGFTNNLTIGANVKTIGNHAFTGCNSIHDLMIPNSVQEIGVHAFSYCDQLTSVTIDYGAELIGSLSEPNVTFFYDCDSLTSIVLRGFNDSEWEWSTIAFSGMRTPGVTTSGTVSVTGDEITAQQACDKLWDDYGLNNDSGDWQPRTPDSTD